MKSLKHTFAPVAACTFVFAAASWSWAHQVRQAPEPPATQSALETPRQLQQLVAPIALYPDALVGQILAAATYPDQIVEADNWMQHNTGLEGAALAQAVDQQPWDSSTKSLTQFPKVLANMDKNLGWTSSLGDEYINQQQDVLAAVQVMRQRAAASGNLQTNAQETVTNQGRMIAIQPTNPQTVYVPQYNPWGVYGAQMSIYPGWSGNPGLYMNTSGVNFGVGFGTGYYSGTGYGWNTWGVDWGGRNIVANRARFVSRSPTFINRNTVSGGVVAPVSATGARAGTAIARRSSITTNRSTYRNFGTGTRSGAFSSFNHGGVARSNSYRGQTSYGGGFGRGDGIRSGGGARTRR